MSDIDKAAFDTAEAFDANTGETLQEIALRFLRDGQPDSHWSRLSYDDAPAIARRAQRWARMWTAMPDSPAHASHLPVSVYALNGEVVVAARRLTIEQADELANAVAEAQLVAMEQKVRAGSLRATQAMAEAAATAAETAGLPVAGRLLRDAAANLATP